MNIKIENEDNHNDLVKVKMYQIVGLAVPLMGILVFIIYLLATGQQNEMFYTFSGIWIVGSILWIISFRKRYNAYREKIGGKMTNHNLD